MADLEPVPASKRTLSWLDFAGLWVGMAVNAPQYYAAASLVDLGMSWYQAIATIVAGNSILLLPLLLAGHPGARYGVPFPALIRATFGPRGAHVPALLRALVGCGWSGIESWIGGRTILLLLPSSLKTAWVADPIPWLGASVLELTCFLLFLLAQIAILHKGMPAIRVLGNYASPVLIVLTLWLFCWAYTKAGGLGEMLSTPSRLGPSEFWAVFFPSLTASIGGWAAVALNISDFTRFAKSQAHQVLGQMGLPIFVGLYSFAGLAIASSTAVIYGRIISDPIDLLAEIDGPIAINIIAFIGISLATITTNLPANFVAPANVLVSLSPATFSFTKGALLTALVSVVFQPWKLMGSSKSFVYTWLVGYSTVVGPISSILLTDYFILRRTVLDVDALYAGSRHGPYYYVGGFNIMAFVAFGLSFAPMVPGFLHELGVIGETSQVFVVIYDSSWFFGFFSAGFIYWVLHCWGRGGGEQSDQSMVEPLRPASA